MKRRWRAAAALLITAAACTPAPTRVALPPERPPAPRGIRVGIVEEGRIRVVHVPVEAYVEAAILSEFAPPGGEPALVERMLEVQAVISRTYAVSHLSRHRAQGFDLCATTHCQLYEPGRLRTSRWAALANQATTATAAHVLWHENGPAEALFHADCGGTTASAADVWGGPSPPYLRGVQDDGPAAEAHRTWTFTASVGDVRAALNADARTAVGASFGGLEILDRDGSGRAGRIAIHGARDRLVTGARLRDVLTTRFGAASVKSTWFTVRRTGNTVRFDGRGFGHGVGLCQVGALARLRAGQSVAAVLERYFPGTTVVTID